MLQNAIDNIYKKNIYIYRYIKKYTIVIGNNAVG